MASKLVAWMQVLAGFLLMFNTWGLINAFGVFQEYYTSFSPPLSNPSSVSWIGSIQIFLLLLSGSATGTFVDRGYAKTLAFSGCGLLALGLLFTSFSGEFGKDEIKRPVYYQILLSQGILSGLGMGLLLVPSTAVVPTYFKENRALAVGLANTGASIGGIIYPIVTRQMISVVGFHWAVRITALLVLLSTALGGMMLVQRPELTQNPGKRKLWDWKCIGDGRYALFAAGIFFAFAGLYIPYFYITAWARDTAIPLHGLQPYYLVCILNAGGLAGRIVPPLLADRVSASTTLLIQGIAALCCGVLAATWTSIGKSMAALLVWIVAYGLFSGSVISLIPASAAVLTTDLKSLGGRLGVVFAGNAFAILLGNPVAGAIWKQTAGDWAGLAIHCAAFTLAGGALLVACWVWVTRIQRKVEIDNHGARPVLDSVRLNPPA
ncbi:MFS general substrate transporter [Periconia macrospinosa]|uniref:MFS general substrate transporter n=1 Tax=Periconia macrospinosa TaxID=97972 RepID=A0A2V1DIC2_9PLEO|nr:MFS general substrate transporter [Periconia macrospinosa]